MINIYTIKNKLLERLRKLYLARNNTKGNRSTKRTKYVHS